MFEEEKEACAYKWLRAGALTLGDAFSGPADAEQ